MKRERQTLDDLDLDALRYSYEALAKRWNVSPWTVRNYVKAGQLGPPKYLSPIMVRFSERMVREFEQSRPTAWHDTQSSPKQKTSKT